VREEGAPDIDGAGQLLTPSVGWVLLGCFSVVWLGLGLLWGRRAKSLDGFMLAGRNVGLGLGAATAVATWITSNTTMLAPQFALELGMWGMLAYCTASLGLLLFAPLARRIKSVMPEGYTSAEFIELRYGKVAWAVFLVISFFYAMTWMVSMGMAGGLLIEALTGIPYFWGMTVILAVCTLYTVAGGLFAVIGTDFIQSIIVLVGVTAVAIAVLGEVSVAEVHAQLSVRRPALLDVLFPAALLALFNNLLFGIGETFHSNVWWSRAFAMREGVGFRAYVLAAFLWLPVPVVAGFLGLAAPALGISIARPDMVAPVVAGTLLGELGAVLVFVVVFSSLASSIDSLLAATSDLATKEVVGRFFLRGASDERMRRVAGRAVLVIGGLTWLICIPRVGTLATVLFFAGPLVASTIWPILAGLFWRRASPGGAVAAMVAGSAVGLVVYFTIGWYAASTASAFVSCVLTVGLASRARTPFDFARLSAPRAEAAQ
jgi:Na+/proline symporter